MIQFSPNCTLPLAAPAFVESANVRGTMDIVWNCLSIILLCTWSILHLNVPPQHEPVGMSQMIGKAAFDYWKKFRWMVVTIFCPEVILGLAAVDLYAARSSRKKIAELAKEDGVPWSLSHSYFANIGAFAIRFPDDPMESMSAEGKTWQWRMLREQMKGGHLRLTIRGVPVCMIPKAKDREESQDQEESHCVDQRYFPTVLQRHVLRSYICGDTSWAPHKGNSTLADDIVSDPPSDENESWSSRRLKQRLVSLRGNIWVLNTWGLLEARKAGIINRLPCFTESELADRDKGDTLSKLIAVSQVALLVAQLIQRYYYDQPSSQLEIMTLAFAVQACFTYCLLLRRPKGVSAHTFLPAARSITNREEMLRILKTYPQDYTGPGFNMSMQRWSYTIPNGTLHGDPADPLRAALINNIGIAAGGAIFGAVHLSAWDFEFPTLIEKHLWRAAAMVVTTMLPAMFLLVLLVFVVKQHALSKEAVLSRLVIFITAIGIFILGAAFVVSRLYLLAESFRLVYYLPPGAYVATGTAEAPNLA